MSLTSYQLDKCLAQCDSLIHSFKENPKKFIDGLSQKSKKTVDNSKRNEISGEKSEDEESDSDLDAFSDLKKKMIKTYLELKEEEAEDEDVNRYALNLEGQLIEKVVKKLNLSYLILNLYPNDQGYSIGLKKCFKQSDKNVDTNCNGISSNSNNTGSSESNKNKATINSKISSKNNNIITNKSNGDDTICNELNDTNSEPEIIETIKLPYEEEDLLDFIDNEELPPMLVDIFDNLTDDYQIFYCGSIFMEIRDYRKNASSSLSLSSSSSATSTYFESSFVRLKPTNQTLLNDVARLTSSFAHLKNWTQEEKTALEAKLIIETAEPLCLDPNPVVAIISNRLDYERKWIKASKNVERLMRRNSQIHRNRVKKFEALPAPKGLELFDFLKTRTDRTPIATRLNKKINSTVNRKYSIDPIDPKLVEIEKFAKKLDPVVFKNDNSLVKCDEYTMEFLTNDGRSSTPCVTIYHRAIDDSYFGKLFLDKRKDNLNKSGNSCLFRLGHKTMVEKYIDQFKEILTENGRKPVKITHRSPNQPPKVTYTISANSLNGSTPNDSEDSDGRENLAKKPKILQTNSKNALSVLPNSSHKLSSSLLSATNSSATSSSSPSPSLSSSSASLASTINFALPTLSNPPMNSPTPIPVNASIPSNPLSTQINSNCVANHQASLDQAASISFKNVKPSQSFVPIEPISNLKPKTICNSTISERETIPTLYLTSVPPIQASLNQQNDCKPVSETIVVTSSLPIGTYTITGTNSSSNTGLPQGVNLASLSLAQCSNLRLHNLVSFPNVQRMPQQQITVPISLTMMQGTGSNQTPNTVAGAPNNIVTNSIQHQQATGLHLTASPGSMIVGIEANSGISPNTIHPNSSQDQQQSQHQQHHNLVVLDSSSDLNLPQAQTAVLMQSTDANSSTQNVLSVPIDVAGNIVTGHNYTTQLMSLKSSPTQNPLSLLRVGPQTCQQNIPVLRQVTMDNSSLAHNQIQSPPPLASVNSGSVPQTSLLTSQEPMTGFTRVQLPGGGTASIQLTPQQQLQLALHKQQFQQQARKRKIKQVKRKE